MSAPAPPRYPIPASRHRVEEVILRSRFITTVAPAATVEEAQAFMAEMRAEFADASHNCWAYVVGQPGSTGQNGMSDDGEPHGTAGRPMLTVLLHSGIGDVVAVVTRYFGGTLLGKGGLVRAYSGGVQLALESLPTAEKVEKRQLALLFDYSFVTPVQRMLPDYEAEVLSESYGVDVSYRVEMPVEQVEPFRVALTNLTNDQAVVEEEEGQR
ncbi:MAG: YigZ family protein [Caldilineaceae bacterium]|nr:YigZ family protein [Caldilineaceae bacterium]HRJ44513.1 YigZ family protein [Caldilineaceae bacterium]